MPTEDEFDIEEAIYDVAASATRRVLAGLLSEGQVRAIADTVAKVTTGALAVELIGLTEVQRDLALHYIIGRTGATLAPPIERTS